MSMGLRVEKWGHGYAVFDGVLRLTGPYSCRDIALRALDRKEAEAWMEAQGERDYCALDLALDPAAQIAYMMGAGVVGGCDE